MRRQERLKAVLSAILVVMLCVGAVLAQGPPPPGPASDEGQVQTPEQGQAPDPPGRVARLQYMSGQVSIQPGGVR